MSGDHIMHCNDVDSAKCATDFASPFDKENAPMTRNTKSSTSGLDTKLKESGNGITVQILRQSVSPLSQFTPQRTDTERAHQVYLSHSGGGTDAFSPSTNGAADTSVSIVDCCDTSEDTGSTRVQVATGNDLLPFEEKGLGTATFSPSDSFDWRLQLSPLAPQQPKRSRRRSSFGLIKRPTGSTGSSVESPHNRTPDAGKVVVESPTEMTNLTSSMFARTAFTRSPGIQDQKRAPALDLGHHLSFLEPISEDSGANLFGGSHIEMQCRSLLENREVKGGSRAKKSYERQIAPFRHLFEALPKLRKENEALKQENLLLAASRAETEHRVEESIINLQSQMATTLQAAIEKAQRLQEALDASESKNQELQNALSAQSGTDGLEASPV